MKFLMSSNDYSSIFIQKEGCFIQTRIYDFLDDVVRNIIDDLYSIDDEYANVSIIAKYDVAKDLIAELMCLDVDVVSIDIAIPDIKGYNEEYIISIDREGLWCEELYDSGKYSYVESNVVYVHEDCNSLLFDNIRTDSNRVFEFAFGEDK